MRTATTLLALAAAAVAEDSSEVGAVGHSCLWTDPYNQATYDFGLLYNANADYYFADAESLEERNRMFRINFCGNTVGKPEGCDGASTMAWEYDPSQARNCRRLSGPYSQTAGQQNINFRGYERDASELGYRVTLLNGEANADCPTGHYQLEIAMGCDELHPSPTAGMVDNATYIKKIDECTDELHIYSRAGCPTQCPATDQGVCHSKGMCAFDSDLGHPRCFCFDGYIESDCATRSAKKPVGAIVGAVFGGLAMGLLGVGVFFWYYHLREGSSANVNDMDGYYNQDA